MNKKNRILILGYRSFLSQYLKKKLKFSKLIKSKEVNSFEKKLDKKLSYTIIINLFYPTFFLKDFNKKNFETISDRLVFLFLNKLANYHLIKIIYTSSSIAKYPNLNKHSPRYFYQIKKKEMEKKITKFCQKRKIPLVITRPYNIYGEGDKFSIISKLKKLKIGKIKKLTISNQGNIIRDFVNIKDVAKVYLKIIKSNIYGTISIGTGKGIKLIDLIKKLKLGDKVIFLPKNNFEIKKSVCNIKNLKKIINTNSFMMLGSYFNLNNNKI